MEDQNIANSQPSDSDARSIEPAPAPRTMLVPGSDVPPWGTQHEVVPVEVEPDPSWQVFDNPDRPLSDEPAPQPTNLNAPGLTGWDNDTEDEVAADPSVAAPAPQNPEKRTPAKGKGNFRVLPILFAISLIGNGGLGYMLYRSSAVADQTAQLQQALQQKTSDFDALTADAAQKDAQIQGLTAQLAPPETAGLTLFVYVPQTCTESEACSQLLALQTDEEVKAAGVRVVILRTNAPEPTVILVDFASPEAKSYKPATTAVADIKFAVKTVVERGQAQTAPQQ